MATILPRACWGAGGAAPDSRVTRSDGVRDLGWHPGGRNRGILITLLRWAPCSSGLRLYVYLVLLG